MGWLLQALTKLFFERGKIVPSLSPITVRRTETLGVLNALLIIRQLHNYFKIEPGQHGAISIWCDNLSTVLMIQKVETPSLTVSTHGAPDIDVILQINEECKFLTTNGYKVEIQHIKAHQKIPIDLTDPTFWPITLNKEADWLAGSAHIKNVTPHHNDTRYPATNLTISCDSEQIHSGMHTKIRNAYNKQPLIEYLQERFSWSNTTFDSIWWLIHGQALSRLPPIKRLVIQKFNMDHWACNHREATRGMDNQKWCEVCYHHEETCDHIIQCNDANRQTIRNSMMDAIQLYFKKTGTPRAMRNCITQGIQTWLQGKPTPNISSIEPQASNTLKLAYSTQTAIGWRHFLRGRIAIQWASLVNGKPVAQNLATQGILVSSRNCNPITWGSGLLHILWKHILNFWKVRNDTIVEIYKQKGITRPHFNLIRLATLELQSGEVGHQERDWMNRDPEDFRRMDMNSLIIWIRRVKAAKKLFQAQLQTNQPVLRWKQPTHLLRRSSIT